MTPHDKMIEALAVILEDYRCGRDGKTAKEAAAAVLDLCGPKKLVWLHPSSANFKKGECFHARGVSDHHAVHKVRDGWWYNVDSKTYPTLELAQSAAQAHADAAHWANTALGDMIGGEP